MTADEALAAAEHAVDLSGSDPARALALARSVLAALPASCREAAARAAPAGAPQGDVPATGAPDGAPDDEVPERGPGGDFHGGLGAGPGDAVAGRITGCGHCETEAVAHRALAVAARELGDLPFAEERLGRAVRIALSAGLPHRAA
ncbi:hypothetical protein AB0C32_20785, partial [Streptosporangium sp. NPDC048865]